MIHEQLVTDLYTIAAGAKKRNPDMVLVTRILYHPADEIFPWCLSRMLINRQAGAFTFDVVNKKGNIASYLNLSK